jgi:hypothetical protein
VADDMERLREIFTYVCAAMGTFALILAVYHASNNRLQAAMLLGVGFVLCGMFVFISQIKAFKVWQIEVQLRERLNEADEILGKLRQLSITSAKAIYLNVGKGSRWGSQDVAEKQVMLDEVDNQLKGMIVSLEERRAISAGYLKIVGFDFYMLYARTLERYWEFKHQDMQRELGKNPSDEKLRIELNKWTDGLKSWKPNYHLFSQLDSYLFEDEINRITPSGWLSERDQRAVEAFRNQVISLYKASQAKGGLTKEAAEYYDKYSDLSGYDKKIIELFNFDPSAPR